jgi:tetratricopeptide (TPR) repeat protein
MVRPSPAHILGSFHASRQVIQDFCPLPDSIEWKIGQDYLRERGNKAFTSDPEPVPFAINNDGSLSIRTAEVFFASLVAAEQTGTLEPTIFVLELGIGVGLFARFFLDSFRQLCEQNGKDYYDRLCYVAADYSEKMLIDACRHGVFANHPGRYVLRVVDALYPELTLTADPLFSGLAGQPFQAIFLNYLLDCLPAAVLKVEGEEIRQLWVRSCLARGTDLKDYCDLQVEEIARLVQTANDQHYTDLRQVFGLLASEYEYRPVDPLSVPYGEFGVRFACALQQRAVVHSYGALQALEHLLSLLHETGFILINDYSSMRPEGADDFQHQRYSQSTFIGLNFPLLESYFTQVVPAQWIEPPEGEHTSIHARLLGRQLTAETVSCFQERFGKVALEQNQEAVQLARTTAKAGRLEAALTAYQVALEHQPFNWALMNEVAYFLTFTLRDPAAGLEMAKAALACNPTCSADLLNMLGDSLFELGRIEESRQAYLRALQINPDDPRAHFNLAFVHVRTKEYKEALHGIAEALFLDKTGIYRDRLLHTQTEVLAYLTQRHEQEALRMANRVHTRPKDPKPGTTPRGGNTKAEGDPNREQPNHKMGGPPSIEATNPHLR